MKLLLNKHVLIGITGGIAAYKSAEIVRLLIKFGANVRVVMTDAACKFITPLTLQALSQNPVSTSLLDPNAEAAMGHIELARWADLILIAPASADFIARLNHGHANDLLTTICLASKAILSLAPAMNQVMWANKTTQDNINALQKKGYAIFGPDIGEQACGDHGVGRMLEPNNIVKMLANNIEKKRFSGIHIMITAGGTREYIDPVRFIANRSSGKMAYALAQAAIEEGASVTLISGCVEVTPPAKTKNHSVVSAQQMFDTIHQQIHKVDIFIGCAAVADYRPDFYSEEKLKRNTIGDKFNLQLTKNPDILTSITQLDNAPFTVGFSAETTQIEQNAQKKLLNKKLQMIIANDVSDTSIGFSSDDNEVIIMTKQSQQKLHKSSKTLISKQIINQIDTFYQQWKQNKIL